MEEPLEETQEVEDSEARREFITKLVTAAGAVAVSGLVAGAAGAEVVGKIGANEPVANLMFPKVEIHKAGTTQYKLSKLKTGFRVVLQGRELGNSLIACGMLPPDANLNNSRITIEFTY